MNQFVKSLWTDVIYPAGKAGDANASTTTRRRADEALNELCRMYWPPIYAYARSRGYSPQDAEDLTQNMFEDLVQKQLLARADRKKGKFRTFLLTHFKYVIQNQWKHDNAHKRGGIKVNLPTHEVEKAIAEVLDEKNNPAKVFDRIWANQVVDHALQLLESEYNAKRPDVPLHELKGFLPGGAACQTRSYAELEARYHVKKQALMTRVSRLNSRFRELLVAVVSDTVSDPAEVDAEMKFLVTALTGN